MPGADGGADQVRQEWRPLCTQPIKEACSSRAAVQGEGSGLHEGQAKFKFLLVISNSVVLSSWCLSFLTCQMGVKLFSTWWLVPGKEIIYVSRAWHTVSPQ